MNRSYLFAGLASSLGFALSIVPAEATPKWIWTSKEAKKEQATFRKSFTVSGPVKKAVLSFTCDNGATAYLNGVKVAENEDWNSPTNAALGKLLKAGENELRFDARNEGSTAGLVATLTIELADGKKSVVETGGDWAASATATSASKPAVEIIAYGGAPWGNILDSKPAGLVLEGDNIQTPPGFKVELLYTVPKEQEGSWVAMTEDDKGRLITSDQYGGLFRVTLPTGKGDEVKVEPLKLPNGKDGKPLGGAHGLLYAFDSLYLMNNEMADHGLWRLTDTNRDDQFDKAEFIRKCDGSSEHGPHGIVLGPDGKSIYFVNGNHTKLPENLDFIRPTAIGEDHLITRMWDPNGHARGILAPGGYVCKTDPEGKRVELFAGGFRNQYDIAFDANGELFTYDSDMEWDMGSPWYVPTRINHIVSGGDYGWRSGSGRWPSYYADSLPAAVDIGPGSPTGTVFGTGAKFPAKYQRAMYALDWTYGTMWAIHFKPDGASFKAEKEEFVAGKPMPFTDALIRREDGAMYFTTGGRKSQSALYRVTYTGSESTGAAPKVEPTPEAKLRRALETLQAQGTGPDAVAKAWPSLASKDRFLRFVAREAIERQPSEKWADKALAETNPQASIEALIALARVGDKSLQPKLFVSLGRLDFNKLPADLRLPYLRAWELVFTRMGKPAPDVCEKIAERLDPLFPNAEPFINRELVNLLVSLGSHSIVAKTVPMLDTAKDADITIASDAVLARNDGYASAVAGMHDSHPNRQAIAYATALREAKTGWTPELRKTFFSWFPHTSKWRGGNSFRGFLNNIRSEALENCVPDATERAAMDTLSKQAPPAVAANIVMPKGPGKDYTADEIASLAKDGMKGRNFEQGKAMFTSQLCINCHHFGGEGGNSGPDLTGAGNRYTIKDLAENIVEPSKVISDQYPSEQIDLKDGGVVVGRVVVEENGKLFVMTSALAPDALTTVDSANVKGRQRFSVSMMPPGLLTPLNKDELLDLLAYILAAGNPKDPRF
ncbi:MAG: c-type cytochrome [Luteolibacter sp.]|uniref:c-type cytochrome n=1 Tax=Luteolibacter sp. TaxID=1962973 RepID=UPI0032658D36